MASIELFPVPDRAFSGGPEFREYLAAAYNPDMVDNALTIVLALTKHPKAFVEEALTGFGFRVRRRLGRVLHLECDVSEGKLETYLTYEEDSGVMMFYTNFRKTEEIPRLKDFLRGDVRTYPLFLRPYVLQRLLDTLADQNEDLKVVDFTARRYPGSKQPAKLRPEVDRTFGYWADDGRETLAELRHQYGVLPNRLVVDIPGKAKFGIDSKGLFTFHRGDLKMVFEIMGQAIDDSREAIQAFEGSSFQVFPVRTAEKEFGIPTSVPVVIRLRRKFAFAEAEDFRGLLDDQGYTILGFTAEEGSLFLSSDVVSKSGHRFRIKANEEKIKMLPDGDPQFSAFMEFYEFVLNSVDPEAELVTRPHGS